MKKYYIEKGTVRRSGIFQYAILAILVSFQASLFTIKPTKVPQFVAENTFSYFDSASAQEATPAPIQEPNKSYSGSLLFMGDTMLARGIGDQINQGANPFVHLTDVISTASLRIANIETTIADPLIAQQQTKPYTFNAPLKSLDVLKSNNIDVSVLANNHTGDFGSEATANMIDQFEAKQLSYVGIGKNTNAAFKPLIKNMNLNTADGEQTVIQVAFIAVNDIELEHTKVSDTQAGGAYLDKPLLESSIKQAKDSGADLVVVVAHWGVEYQEKPSTNQEYWGRYFIDSGADMVIGGHPHVIQPTEIYKDKPIVYSMGNFIFDGMSGEALKGQMISVPVSLNITHDGQYVSKNVSVGALKPIQIQIDSLGLPNLR